jgi:hypothetical protein
MININVGDLVWIIDADRHTIIPARVNEQIVSKTVAGEKTYHNIEFPSGKSQRLEKIAAVWYPTLSDVRTHLLERAQTLIEKTVSNAKEVAEEKFEIIADDIRVESQVNLSEEAFISSPETPDSVKVSLDSGQIVNVKVPQEFLDESFSD